MNNVEDHYAEVIKIVNDLGPEAKELGIGVAWAYLDDPKHLLFTLSRYKFVSKMFDGMKKVLEIGCGDGFASRLLLQNITSLVAIDIDKLFIDDAKRRQSKSWPIDFRIHDILDDGPIHEEFDGVVSLDVMEHIPEAYVRQTFEEIFSLTTKFAFFVIATQKAKKLLPDGRNAHLTVQKAEWWLDLINELKPEGLIVEVEFDEKRRNINIRNEELTNDDH